MSSSPDMLVVVRQQDHTNPALAMGFQSCRPNPGCRCRAGELPEHALSGENISYGFAAAAICANC